MDTALAVAIVGVGGTLAGVALTLVGHGLAESRRYERDESARFHSDRRAVYARFLAHLSVRRKHASDLSTYWDTPYFPAVRDAGPDEGEWLREAQEIMAEIHLLGDTHVIRAATSLLMTAMAAPLIMFAPSAPQPSREQVRERAASGEKIFKDAYGPCLDAMRASLNMPEAGGLHVV
ncbi:hypothetical protein [Nocardioides sp. InS609-2]|uniref:hypothetical protein n=1 Tax=Nocardioides sp. InS609-2 TaxID=2760705 RepID=UPI0020C01FF4|nr:hypothetical protein [Nocardioides sp. InS609-2]